MLSVGQDTPRFSPSKNIHVKSDPARADSVMYITDKTLFSELGIKTGGRPT
jgi:hypothetical protein